MTDKDGFVRGSDGRFAPGGKGGPGRRPGTISAERFGQIVGHAKIEQIIGVVAERALEGDLQAARLILDRVSPIADARVAELLDRIQELEERLDQRRAA